MSKAKITSKGQLTLPKDVRDEMGLGVGDEVEFVKDNGTFRLKKHVDPDVVDEWMGFLKHLEGCRTDDIMDELRGE